MAFNRTSWIFGKFAEGESSAVRAPEAAGWPNLHVRREVLPRRRDVVRYRVSVLKRPLLFGPVQLSQFIDASVKGVPWSLKVSGIAEKLGVGERGRFVAKCHRISAHLVEAAARVANEYRGCERNEPDCAPEPRFHPACLEAVGVPHPARKPHIASCG